MRNLKSNERTIYAPYCNLGFLNFEKSGGYISIPDDYVVFSKKDRPDVMMDNNSSKESGDEQSEEGSVEEGVQMVRDL
jgi:ribosome biogenesis protein BMS1